MPPPPPVPRALLGGIYWPGSNPFNINTRDGGCKGFVYLYKFQHSRGTGGALHKGERERATPYMREP
jgi:hypothetical protein